jgi:hypothetical protein
MARSEYVNWPPGRPLFGVFQASTAASSNQNVMSPRLQRDSSHAGQFSTRYFFLYFGVTLLFVLAAMARVPLSAASTMVYRRRDGGVVAAVHLAVLFPVGVRDTTPTKAGDDLVGVQGALILCICRNSREQA